MIVDVIRLRDILDRQTGVLPKAINALTTFIDGQLGSITIRDATTIPLGDSRMVRVAELGQLLLQHGVIKGFGKTLNMPDEPRISLWQATCGTSFLHMTGGITTNNDSASLTAALAEALERYIWFEQDDYFIDALTGTEETLSAYNVLQLDRFAGFTGTEHENTSTAEMTWIKALSHVQRRNVYIPAQIISGKYARESILEKNEVRIRQSITTGLATFPTEPGAVLRGALEVIERDAFMVMWLNQLTLPRISFDRVRASNTMLDSLLTMCERHKLRPHLIELITDAPASVACVVVEDLTGTVPRFTVGACAGRSIANIAEKALLEALRARVNVRRRREEGVFSENDALEWWSHHDRDKGLKFLIDGMEHDQIPHSPWEHDTDEEHLKRIIAWCRETSKELISVDLGKSAKNPTPWHIAMVCIPELQPLYKDFHQAVFGYDRLAYVPKQFGFKPRKEPFTDAPHPFT